MTLSVLVPTTIDDTFLISSTVPENDYAAWSNVTAYIIGDRCISTTTHRIYLCLIGNTNKDPTDIANHVTTAYWLDDAPTNRYAMFDNIVSTQTVVTSPLTVVIRPGFFNAFSLFGLDAETLTVTIKDAPSGTTIYSYTGDLEGSAPGDYDDYFWAPFVPATDFIASNIDPYLTMEITLTLASTATPVKCGILAIGDMRPLGDTQYGAKAKPKTYSYIGVDAYGNNQIIRRKSAKDMSCSAWLKLSEANAVIESITNLMDVPCAWIAAETPEHSGLRAFGLGSGEISYDHPQDCLLTLNVQGTI